MARYYFDLRDDGGIISDDEGLELSSLQRAQEEAARSLADMARDAISSRSGNAARAMSVEVRDADGPLLQVRFMFEIRRF
jgi:hypothetical protein